MGCFEPVAVRIGDERGIVVSRQVALGDRGSNLRAPPAVRRRAGMRQHTTAERDRSAQAESLTTTRGNSR
jgi:hypothetical protein